MDDSTIEDRGDAASAARRSTGRKRQTDIYIAGLRGEEQALPVDPARLDEKAREVMSPEAFGYVAGRAGMEKTMAANLRNFDRWGIAPRMLRDVSSRDYSVELFGHRYDSPFMLAPVGVLEMAHPEADLAVARAAAAEHVPMIFTRLFF